jgi:hypothetical protein
VAIVAVAYASTKLWEKFTFQGGERLELLERRWLMPGSGVVQAYAGFWEMSNGIKLIRTGVGAPLGVFLVLHGFDHVVAGVRTFVDGAPAETLTCRLLQQNGISPRDAGLMDTGINVFGTFGGSALLRGATTVTVGGGRFALVTGGAGGATVRAAGSAVKAVDVAKSQVIPLRRVQTVGDFTYSETAARHYFESAVRGPNAGRLSRPFMRSPLTIEEIMNARAPMPDPRRTPGTLYWEIPGTFRGSEGTWELLIHPETNTIYHFNFR